MKNLTLTLLLAGFMTGQAYAAKPGDTDSPADKAVSTAILAGDVMACDNSDYPGNTGKTCKGHDTNYRIFYAPDRKTALVWVFGYPLGGTGHFGEYAEFKDENGWKFVKVFKKPLADAPAPEEQDIQFLPPKAVKVTYHFKKETDSNCCSTGVGHAVLNLQ
mgnify:CR=1 FL=1